MAWATWRRLSFPSMLQQSLMMRTRSRVQSSDWRPPACFTAPPPPSRLALLPDLSCHAPPSDRHLLLILAIASWQHVCTSACFHARLSLCSKLFDFLLSCTCFHSAWNVTWAQACSIAWGFDTKLNTRRHANRPYPSVTASLALLTPHCALFCSSQLVPNCSSYRLMSQGKQLSSGEK